MARAKISEIKKMAIQATYREETTEAAVIAKWFGVRVATVHKFIVEDTEVVEEGRPVSYCLGCAKVTVGNNRVGCTEIMDRLHNCETVLPDRRFSILSGERTCPFFSEPENLKNI
jgi:hypothetical protein